MGRSRAGEDSAGARRCEWGRQRFFEQLGQRRGRCTGMCAESQRGRAGGKLAIQFKAPAGALVVASEAEHVGRQQQRVAGQRPGLRTSAPGSIEQAEDAHPPGCAACHAGAQPALVAEAGKRAAQPPDARVLDIADARRLALRYGQVWRCRVCGHTFGARAHHEHVVGEQRPAAAHQLEGERRLARAAWAKDRNHAVRGLDGRRVQRLSPAQHAHVAEHLAEQHALPVKPRPRRRTLQQPTVRTEPEARPAPIAEEQVAKRCELLLGGAEKRGLPDDGRPLAVSVLYLRSTPRKPARQRRPARSRGARGAAPGLRFLGEPRALVRSRPLVIAGSLLARLGAIDAIATWPEPAAPTVALDLRDATSDRWMGPMLPRRAHALRLNSRAWQIARARGLVIPRGRSVLHAAAERALGRALNRPALSLYSPSGCSGKLTCFVSEPGRSAPSAVLKVMAERRHGWWLQREVGAVGAVAELLGPRARAALLEVPLLTEQIDGDYVVVERYCELERCGERSSAACAHAHAWLRELHESTTRSRAAWSQADTAAGVDAVLDAWRLVRPHTATRVARLTERRLRRLYRAPLARCATHGDFSPCNLAAHDGQLEVLDSESSRLH